MIEMDGALLDPVRVHDTHPCAAFAYDRTTHTVRLYGGQDAPVVRYTHRSQHVEHDLLDLYDEVTAIYRLPNGELACHDLRRQSAN